MKWNRFAIFLTLILWALGVSTAFADVDIKPEGKVYAFYSYNVSGYPDWYDKYMENDYNKFELSRVYFGAKAKLSDHWTMRIVSDVARSSSYEVEPVDEDEDGETDSYELTTNKNTGKYDLYIKYAYLDYAYKSYLNIRGGQHGTPWIPFVEKLWTYRWIQKVITDKNKLDSSADLGMSVYGDIPGGFGGYQVGVFNGEWYKATEENEGKALHGMFYLTPFPSVDALKGLTAAGSYRYNKVDPFIEHTTTLYSALVHYRLNFADQMGFGLGVEYLVATEQPDRNAEDDEIEDSMGYSIFGRFDFTKKLALFGRYDYFDPDTQNDKDKDIGYRDETTYLIAGVSYQPIKYVSFALDYQTTSYTAEVKDDDEKTQTKPTDSSIYVNAEFKF